MKITPTSLTLNQLFSSSNEQYVIPAYQRRYSWHERQVMELVEDIVLLEGADTHLLGNIVCLTDTHTAGLNRLELVDGQQRLTTISILFACISERLVRDKRTDLASEVSRLQSARAMNGNAMPKVLLDSIDAKEFADLLKADNAAEYKNDNLRHAFVILRKWADDQTPDSLSTFLFRLQTQAFVIRLDVSDAKDAFKLFETINNRGLRLSPTDIIKNFLLGNASRLESESLEMAREAWTKLIWHLDGASSDSFFRDFLSSLTKRRVTKTYVVSNFKELFMNEVLEAAALPDRHSYVGEDEGSDDEGSDDAEPDGSTAEHERGHYKQISLKQFLARLVLSAKTYGELVLAKTGNTQIDRHLRSLRMIKAAATYSYLMHLRVGECGDKIFVDILRLTEALVLRRHVCRERGNDAERLFANLCVVNSKDPIKDTKAAFRGACPSDDKFRDEFASVSFTSNIIDRARYCLEMIELSKQGKYAELQVLGTDSVHVEHIIPQKIKTKRAKDAFGDWVTYLGEKAELSHPKYVSRIGNLTLFAGALNIGASNNPFAKKQNAYRQSSILITQELATMDEFKFDQIDQRSRSLAALAVELWPAP